MNTQITSRFYAFFLIFLPCMLTAQVEVGEIEQVYNDGCNGSIEIILEGEEVPYTIEFEGEGNEFLLTSIEENYTFHDLCPGEYTILVTNSYGCEIDLGMVILQNCDPLIISPEAVLYHPSACDENDGTIRFFNPFVEGGTAPYTGVLLDQNGTETDLGIYWEQIGGLYPGDYTFTLFDANNCEQEFFYTLNGGEDEPNINTTIEPSCEGQTNGSIFISAVAPDWDPILYDFVWSNGTTTNNSNYSSINGLAGGNYSVTITNPNNDCQVVRNIVVPFVLNEMLTVSTQSEISCPGVGTINASVVGGMGPYTFCRTNGGCPTVNSGNVSFYFLDAGSYCVTVTDLCGNTGVSCLEVTSFPEMEITSEVTQDDVAPGGQGAIDLTVSGGTPPYSFYWYNIPNFPDQEDLNNLVAGDYTVKVVDANGCEKIISFELVTCGDEFLFGAYDVWNMTPCDSESGTPGELVIAAIGGEVPYTYEWHRLATAGGTIIETYDNNAPSLTVTQTGYYQVVITDLCGNTRVYNRQVECECDLYYTNFDFNADVCLKGGANIEFAYDGSPWGGAECQEVIYVEWPDGTHSEIRINGFGSDLDYSVFGEDSYEVTEEGQECITIRTGCGCEYQECWYFGTSKTYIRHVAEPINEHLTNVTATFPVYVGCGECRTCGPDEIPYFEGCPNQLENEEDFEYTPAIDFLTNPCARGVINSCGTQIEVPLGTSFTEYVDLDNTNPTAFTNSDGDVIGCMYECHCLYPSDAFDQLYFDKPVLVKTELLVLGDDNCEDDPTPPPPPPPPPGGDECASGLFDYEYSDDCWVDKYCYDNLIEDWVYLSTDFIGEICWIYPDFETDFCTKVVSCNIQGVPVEIYYENVLCDWDGIECDIAFEGGSNNGMINNSTENLEMTNEKFSENSKGKFSFSPTLTAENIKLYPNPTTGKLHVMLDERKLSDGVVSVIDLVGKEVFLKKYKGNVITIDLENKLKTGIYYLKLNGGNGLVTYHKFVYVE